MTTYRCKSILGLCKWSGVNPELRWSGSASRTVCPECGSDISTFESTVSSNTITEPAKQTLGASKEQADPTGKAAKEPGSKLDLGKSPVVRGALQYFPRALSSIAEVSQKGAEKYTWKGWESVPDGFVRYSDALGRHLLSESIEDIDDETGCLHAAQVAWNALARLELLLKDREG